MKFLYVSIKYRYSRSFCCNHTCYCVGIVTVTIASRYVTSASRCQSRSSMCIRGLIPRNWTRQFRLVGTSAQTRLGLRCSTMQEVLIAHVLIQAYMYIFQGRTDRQTDGRPTRPIIIFPIFFKKCTKKKILYLHVLVVAINHSGFETAAKNPITTRSLLAIKSRVV